MADKGKQKPGCRMTLYNSKPTYTVTPVIKCALDLNLISAL